MGGGQVMCPLMDAEPEIHVVLPERLLVEQIAATVRKIQWTYALFWSPSTKQPGALVWSAGCYNGQIKTRKTTQPIEFDADQTGLHLRSKQLRELYESLASRDCNQQTKRPCASLSPEDLNDTEWYYLVCMSFTFTLGQGLPGKTFVKNQYTWLNNTADSMLFSRSLLAKGAGIQTIVCIPIMGGVLELGTIEQINDDPALVMRITSFFWEIPNQVCTEQSISGPMKIEDEAEDSIILDEQNLIIDSQTSLESIAPTNIPFTQPPYVHTEKESDNEVIDEPNTSIFEELNAGSPEDNSNECCTMQQLDDLFRIDGLNSMSQTQNEQLMDDDFSNVPHCSFNSNQEVSTSFANAQRTRNTMPDNPHEGNHSNLISLDLNGEDSHYMSMVIMIFQKWKPDGQVLCSLMASHNSNFVGWKGDFDTPKPLTSMPQKLLKKILACGVWLQSGNQIKQHQQEKGLQEKVLYPKGQSDANHVLSERRRREQLNEKFLVLKSLIPSISKIDKASVLGDIIEHVKKLQRRVQQLETCRQPVEFNTRDLHDAAARTSDNRCSKEMMNSSGKPLTNKRKAYKMDTEYHWVLSRGGPISINVTMKGKEVLVEMHCPWRECLLLQIVESISDLHLDPLMVQSSTIDGILVLTIKSQFRSSTAASLGMIKGSLERVIGRCL